MPYKKKPTASLIEDIVGTPIGEKATVEEKPEVSEVIPVAPVIHVQTRSEPVVYEQAPIVPTQEVSGILDIQPEGHGFLRPRFIPSPRDIYISQSQIRRFMLRPGDLVAGVGRPPKDTERYFGLLKVETVNGMPADESLRRPYFDELDRKSTRLN